MDSIETRICRICGVTKIISEFPHTHGKIHGRICKECSNRAHRKRYNDMTPEEKEIRLSNDRKCNKTPEQIVAKNTRERARNTKYKERVLYKNACKRARERGLEINIEENDIFIPSVCPVLGIPILRDATINSDNSPSLDRIDNSKGYVKGNVRVISWRANSLKRDANIEEIRSILEYMENMEKSTH